MINFEKQFENIKNKYNEIENSLNNQTGYDSDKLIKLNKEYAELKPIVNTINIYKKDKRDIDELKKLLDDKDTSIKQISTNRTVIK